MPVEMPVEYRGRALVGFLDLLGFSRNILENWGGERDPLDLLLKMKDAASNPANLLKFQTEGDPRSYQPLVTTLSDSIVLRTPLVRGDLDEVVKAYMAALVAVSTILLIAGEADFAVRGGVEIGEVYWNGPEIIGPAFIHAYTLESKIAKTMRVVLGPMLIQAVSTPVVTTSHYFAVQNIHKSHDDLLAMTCGFWAKEHLERLRANAGEHAEKYVGHPFVDCDGALALTPVEWKECRDRTANELNARL
jgi:hypothetical protein